MSEVKSDLVPVFDPQRGLIGWIDREAKKPFGVRNVNRTLIEPIKVMHNGTMSNNKTYIRIVDLAREQGLI